MRVLFWKSLNDTLLGRVSGGEIARLQRIAARHDADRTKTIARIPAIKSDLSWRRAHNHLQHHW